MWTVIEVRG